MITRRRTTSAAAVLSGLAAVALAVTLAGCSGGTAPGSGASSDAPAGPPTAGGDARPLVPLVSGEALEYCPDVGAGHLDGPTDAVEATYICSARVVDTEPDGKVITQETVERVADPAALFEAYAADDEEPTDGMCTMQVEDPLVVWLDLGDEVVAVRAPVDGCGFPTADAKAAYEAADRTLVLEAGGDDVIVPHPGNDE